MDDNATCHRTLAVQDCLDSEGIQRLVWSVRSPDLNPIENVWDALGRQVAGRNYPPTNKNTLIRELTEEWDKLPQQLLDNVVQICKLLSYGLAGIFGPHSPMAAAHVQSISDALEVPHIETRWDYKLQRDDLSINIHPRASTLNQAYIDIVKKWGWQSFIIIYEENEGKSYLHEACEMLFVWRCWSLI
ncbi:glutamate receptor ionotropic, kainate 2 [Trichonephila clavipes]|nr:glutamate receptor ionotropic, kainate 2 [Trichonephila clavipes]